MSELIGDKYSRLTVISVSKKKGNAGQTYLHCQCTCGKEKEVRVDNLTSGHTQSCGCALKGVTKKNRVHITLRNTTTEPTQVTAAQKILGQKRRNVEEILATRALERELCSFG